MQEENVNRNHKDTVFRMLFSEKARLLELYNGLNGTDYQDENELEIYTLENAIYMGMKNDVSFLLVSELNLYEHQSTYNPNMPLRNLLYIARQYTLENAIYMGMKNDVSFLLVSELNLYEHQSTYNPNMPLRNLLYIARQFEKYVLDKSLYSTKRIMLPTPSFVVFYNGMQDQPEKRILKLSDSYAKRTKKPGLELEVLQLNVNAGKNRRLMERSRTLREYSQYVACVRKHMEREALAEAVEHAVTECIQEGILREFLLNQRAEVTAMSIFEYDEEEEKRKLRETEAVEHAVTECIQEGILREFLLNQRAEVTAMSIFEYDEEEEKRKLRETEYEFGREDGLKEGKKEGLKQGKQEGLKQGKEEGLKQGKQEGRKEGRDELLVLARKLLAQGRRGELDRALTEDGYLDQLLAEFGPDAGGQDEKG